MQYAWFTPWGWIYRPVRWQAFILILLTLVFCVQVFIAIDPNCLDSKSSTTAALVADQIVHYFQLPPNSTGERVRYPGDRVLQVRNENLAKGIPVEPSIWEQLQSL